MGHLMATGVDPGKDRHAEATVSWDPEAGRLEIVRLRYGVYAESDTRQAMAPVRDAGGVIAIETAPTDFRGGRAAWALLPTARWEERFRADADAVGLRREDVSAGSWKKHWCGARNAGDPEARIAAKALYGEEGMRKVEAFVAKERVHLLDALLLAAYALACFCGARIVMPREGVQALAVRGLQRKARKRAKKAAAAATQGNPDLAAKVRAQIVRSTATGKRKLDAAVARNRKKAGPR